MGRGILKAIDACQSAVLSEPLIEELGGGIQVSLQKDIYEENFLREIGLEGRLIKALLFIKREGSISNKSF